MTTYLRDLKALPTGNDVRTPELCVYVYMY